MDANSTHRWVYPFAIFLLASCLYLYGSGAISLWDRDEPRFAEASREMLAMGNHLVPTLQGRVRFDKPILSYWLIELAYRVLGVSEFAARFFQALFGGATCAIVALFGSALFRPAVGLLASLILATSPQMVVVSKAATADAPFLFFISLALFAFLQIYEGSRRWGLFICFYGSLALAMLTKGPAGVILITSTILVFLLLSHEIGFLRELRLQWGAPLFFLLVAPWFILANLKTAWGFFTRGILYHTVERAFRPFEGHTGPLFYYPLVLLVGFFPWSPLLPQSLRALFPLEGRSRFLLAWAGVTFGLFTLARTKLPHYILPMYPALALIVALLLTRALAEGEGLLRFVWGKITIWLLGIIPLIFSVLLLFATWKVGFDEELPLIGAISFLLVVISASSVFLFVRRRDVLGVALLSVGISCFILLVVGVLLPALERYKISKPIAEEILAGARSDDLIATFGFGEPSLVFYLKRRVVELQGVGRLIAIARSPRHVWVVMPCERFLELQRKGNLFLYLMAARRGFNFANGKWISLCIARNFDPPTGRGERVVPPRVGLASRGAL